MHPKRLFSRDLVRSAPKSVFSKDLVRSALKSAVFPIILLALHPKVQFFQDLVRSAPKNVFFPGTATAWHTMGQEKREELGDWRARACKRTTCI